MGCSWDCSKIKECCCCCQKRSDEFSPVDGGDEENGKRRSLRCRIFIWTGSIFAGLLVLAFFVIFVVFPLVFQNNLAIQTFVIFADYDQPSNPEYTNFKKYDAVGVRNTYISVPDTLSSKTIKLGVWQILHRDTIDGSDGSDQYFDYQLWKADKPILIYFHGQSGTRIFPMPTYEKLRNYFHIIAMDYRHYADSTEATLTEESVVSDLVYFYKEILNKIANPKKASIYFWGHSLGTGLSTHTLKKLTLENRSKPFPLPKGLVLESPFTTMREEISHHPLGKIFAWLPWFAATILDPLEYNGFLFRTTENILEVNCPIMIMHAEDDSVIPYTLGQTLYNVAKEGRNENQGEVTFHLIPASVRANHMNINVYPGFEKLVEEFLART